MFPEEFDSDGGREDGNERQREGGGQQVTTGTDLWPDFIILDVCN